MYGHLGLPRCVQRKRRRRLDGAQRWRLQLFLGQNALQQWLYDPSTGGCRDGLHADRVNRNQGAEATLSFLLALCEMRAAYRAVSQPASALALQLAK